LCTAEDTAAVLMKDAIVLLQQKFNNHHAKWVKAVSCAAHLDALVSLASASTQSSPMVRPKFVKNSPEPVLSILNGRHPCLVPQPGGDIIPNTLNLGTGKNKPHVMVLTGPNMGGKSTLLRQACITVVMAHMGCYVPAEECSLTAVDRIFTRLGARDDIASGQSTFMVELQETSNVLRYATQNSLVILDELGRGTSTFDGYAIAYSVLRYLSTKIQCRTLFSTHYHALTEEFHHFPNVIVCHMSNIVDDVIKEVTFLYRLSEGACPRSYGLHVAKMAGVPLSVITEAECVANDFHTSLIRKLASRISITTEQNDKKLLLQLWYTINGHISSFNK